MCKCNNAIFVCGRGGQWQLALSLLFTMLSNLLLVGTRMALAASSSFDVKGATHRMLGPAPPCKDITSELISRQLPLGEQLRLVWLLLQL